jgi:hypothetical protein
MKPPRLLATFVCALLAAFAHAAKVGELPAATTSSAPRVAVYLDCSNSMAPYLPAVEAEVRKQFPDADVFSVPAIKVWVDGAVVRGGGTSALAHRPPAKGPRVSVDASRMTPVGRGLLARYAGNFEVGSVGAWVDILRREKRYDALVIFSDFNDQVLQARAGADAVYVDDAAQRTLPEAEIADTRTVPEKLWEDSWVGSFEAAHSGEGPVLYLFSTRHPATRVLQKCAEVSGGNFTLVDWLRPDGPARPTH